LRDRSRSRADHIGGTDADLHIARLRHLWPTKSVDRSIPERPAPMAVRPTFKKIRFQMIGNMFIVRRRK